MEWIADNQALIVVIIMAIWTIVVTVIKLTPTKKDDEFLEKILPVAEHLRGVKLDKVLEVLEAFSKATEKDDPDLEK